MKTGKIQWEHPVEGTHPRNYQLLPKDGSFPSYETLSYCWGSSDKTAVVKVELPENGGLARLPVTESLATALRYLRFPRLPRTLWIDAITLNQEDKSELSQQVPRMGQIYHLAFGGTAWLGVAGNESALALSTLQYLGDQIVAEGDAGLLFCSPSAKELDWYDANVDLPYDTKTWDAVLTLMQRPWFNRLWVVQELQPGTVIQCGKDTISLEKFAEAQYALYCKVGLPPGLRSATFSVDGSLSRIWLLNLPRLYARAGTVKECADPRDKVYGLLGLSPVRFAAEMAKTISYEDSNTATDVFMNAVLIHANITQRLENLHNCFTPREDRKIPSGPSWVPDWVSDLPGQAYIPSQFVATNSRAHLEHSEAIKSDDGHVLKALGVRFGAITRVTEALPPRLPRQEAIQRVRRWQPADLDSTTYKPTGGSLRRVYAITLACNGLKEREPDWIVSTADEFAAQRFGSDALFGDDAVGFEISEHPRQDVSDALQLMADRLLFHTEDGYIGLGPADTAPGDITAVLLGTSTSLVLRPSKDNTGQFSIVGECFVYGQHDAIPLLGPLPSPWRGIAAWVHGDRRVIRFLNTETGEKTLEDPRLTPSDEWTRVDKEPDRDDPTNYDFFQHRTSGEIISHDPRLEPDVLRARDVELTWFSLI